MPDTLDRPKRSVLVLGASGFIGSRVIAGLADNPNYRAIAASRAGQLALDATNAVAMRAALKDVDYVVNCIAGNERTMMASTKALLDGARYSPPVRIVHLSSMAVYGAATGSIAEEQSPTAPLSGYGAAKRAGESMVLKYVHDGGEAVILRPTCVFGPGSSQWTTRIGGLLQQGRLGDLGPAGDGRCNLAFIDDLAAGIIRALTASDISGKAFNVSSSSDLTWNQFLIRFGKALGATPIRRITQRKLRLEGKLLAPAHRLAGLTLGRLGVRSGLAITPSLLALMRQDIRIDCAAAIAELSLPQTPLDRIIASGANFLTSNTPFIPGWKHMEVIG